MIKGTPVPRSCGPISDFPGQFPRNAECQDTGNRPLERIIGNRHESRQNDKCRHHSICLSYKP